MYQMSQVDNVAGPCKHPAADQNCDSCILDCSQQFADFCVEAKRDMQKHMYLKHFRRHECLYNQGEPCDELYVLISGDAKIFRKLRNGDQQIYKVVHTPGEVIGCEDMFFDQHENSAEALEDVSVCCVKRDDLKKNCKQHGFLI